MTNIHPHFPPPHRPKLKPKPTAINPLLPPNLSHSSEAYRSLTSSLWSAKGTWGTFHPVLGPYQLVHVKFEISSWRGARVDVRTYPLGGAIDGSEANGIIRNPKLELESSRFTFDLVPLSYESVDVIVGENWLLRHKAEMVCHEKVVKMPWQEVWNDCRSCKVRDGSNGNLLWEASVLLGRKKVKTVFRMRNGHVEVYGYAFWVNQCTNDFHGVNEPGVRVAREDDRGVTEGREYVREVFQQRGSGAKRKLPRCGRNQMGNEPILVLPEGADDFIVYYDVRSKDLKACLEKGEGDCLYVMLYRGVGRRSEAKNEFEIDVRRSGLVLMPRVVKSRDEIFSRWGYCDNRGLSRLDNQSIERDRLIGIGFVLDFVEFISFTFGDKEMILGQSYKTWANSNANHSKANGIWEILEQLKNNTQADNKKDKTAITFIYQALPEEQLLQITKHKTAKAIWDALKTRHIGEERVQQARLQTLKSDFEMLHMKEDETIDTFTEKLTTLEKTDVNIKFENDETIEEMQLISFKIVDISQITMNSQQTDLEDVEVQEVRPIGRDIAKKKGSSFTSRSSSLVATHRGLIDVLLGNFTKVATSLFRQGRFLSEYLRIKERELEMKYLRCREQAELERLKLA
ncbi:hypothetical protein Tco_1245563 [Tanacetum coccineum]